MSQERVLIEPKRHVNVRIARPVSLLATLDLVLIAALVIANMVHMTGLLLAVTPFSVPAAMVVEYGIVAIYGVVALFRGHVIALLLAAVWTGYLLFMCYLWNQITYLPTNFNAVLSYGTVLMFLPFYETRVPARTVLRLLLAFSIGYVVIYVLLWQPILDIVGRESPIFLRSDGERGDRMYLAAPFVVFVLMYGLSILRRRPIVGILAILVPSYAMVLAQSRFASAILAIGILAAIIGTVAREVRRSANLALAAIFLILSAFSLGGFAVSGFNPYALVSGDGSGAARATEYRDGLAALGDHALTGFGIAANNDDVQLFVKPQRPFFVSDLGVAGVAMQFGLIFAVLLLMLCVRLMTVLPVSAPAMNSLFRGLFYTMQWSAFGTLVGVTVLGGPATLFMALTFACWSQSQNST